MTVEELATVVMSELGYINMCMLIVSVICIAGIGMLTYVVHNQQRIINDLRVQINKINRSRR